ncbi:MAG: hypothetical protein ABWY93_18910 [Mycobacterium sp.]
MTSASSNGTPARKRAPAKKTPARKAGAPVLENATESDLAAASSLTQAFNLDTLERESSVEPFGFIHNGREYVLNDPQEQDWQKLILVVSNPIQFLRLVLRKEDVDPFFANSMPTWKLRALTEAYRDHFGLGELGESGGLSV